MSDQEPLDQPWPTPKPKPNNRRTILIILALGLFFTCAACGIISVLLPDANRTAEVAEQPAPTDEPTETADEPIKPIAAPTESSSPTETSEPAQPEPTAEPPPIPTETAPPSTATPQPTAAPQPTETLPSLPTLESIRDLAAAELALQNALDQALGESNRGLGRKLNLFSPGLPGLMEDSIIIGWAIDTAETNALIREGMERDTLTVLRVVAESGLDYDAVLIGAKYLMPIEHLNMIDEVEVLTVNYNRETINAIDWDTITPGEIFELADFFIINPAFEE